MEKELYQPKDADREPVNMMELSAPHDVDGTSVSAESDPINGFGVRISAVGADIRFVIGASPITAGADAHIVFANTSQWMPIKPGQVVAVVGGIANIATAGR